MLRFLQMVCVKCAWYWRGHLGMQSIYWQGYTEEHTRPAKVVALKNQVKQKSVRLGLSASLSNGERALLILTPEESLIQQTNWDSVS